MNNRRLSFLLSSLMQFTLLLGLAFSIFSPLALAAEQPPNIIYILTDDMGIGDLGSFFQNDRAALNNRNLPTHQTPFLDNLADEGIQLRRHYCPAPVCAPSRASLLLGVHQGHADIRNNDFDHGLDDNHNLARMLQKAGYATSIIGKYGLNGGGATPQSRGFDYFFGFRNHGDAHTHYPGHVTTARSMKNFFDDTRQINGDLKNCYTTDLLTARAKKWIVDQRANQPDQPFFMYLAYDAPHAALQIPTQAYPAGGGLNGGIQWIGTPGNMINTASGTINSWYHPDYANATWDHDKNPATAEVSWPRAQKMFATMVRRIDTCVGDLKQLLEDLQIDDNTLIVFTSDNGPHNESYINDPYAPTFFDSYGPHDGIKRDVLEGGIRMPALAWWPGTINAGQVHHGISQFHDWMPTFAEMAGVVAPARTDGVSLMPTLTGTGEQKEGLVYVEYYQKKITTNSPDFDPSHRKIARQQMQAIYIDGYKGLRYNILSADDDFGIFDTLVDPQEVNDLAGTSPYFIELQQRMKDRVLQVRRPENPTATPGRPYDNALVPSVTATSLVSGVEFKAYEGTWPWCPKLEDLTPVASGTTSTPALTVRTRDEQIGLLYSGFIEVPTNGTYTFYLTADTAAYLRIHEASVIDADYGYIGGTEIAAKIHLEAGLHPYRLYYHRRNAGTPKLSWKWSGPGLAKQEISASALKIENAPIMPVEEPPVAADDAATTQRNQSVLIPVLANDSDDGKPQPLSIHSVEFPTSGTATIEGDAIRYQPDIGFLGQDSFDYTITDGSLTATALVEVVVHFTNDVLWLPFDEAQGVDIHDATGTKVSYFRGFSSASPPWITGKLGSALRFDGRNDRIVLSGKKGVVGKSSRTVSAWVKPTGPGPILAWGKKAWGKKWVWNIAAAAGGGVQSIDVGGGHIIGSRNLLDGQWHHIAAVLENDGTPSVSEIRLYVDGIEETGTVVTERAINTVGRAAIKIGGDYQRRYYKGDLDEVKISPRAYSAAEVLAEAQETLPTTQAAPAAARMEMMSENVVQNSYASMEAEAAQAPNIIYILTDDMGVGDLGSFYQNERAAQNDRSRPWHQTPQLDAIADEGMQLRRHYCPAPVCAPSRASLLLGVHQGHADIRNNDFDHGLDDNHNLARMLKEAGYATSIIGKYGLNGGGATPQTRGFDYFFGFRNHGDAHTHYPGHVTEARSMKKFYDDTRQINGNLQNCYTTDLLTARAKKWIVDHRNTQPAQPFFMYLAYDAPHAALQIPTQAYPAGGGLNGGLQWIGTPGNMINTASGTVNSWLHPDYANATWDHDSDPATAEIDWPRAQKMFATMVRRLDTCVGDLKQLLVDLQIDDNTLIVFTSDNGPHAESYISLSYAPTFFDSYGRHDGIKRDALEGGIRMPALAWWPGTIAPGRIHHGISQFHDWMPTFAEMAGVVAPARTDGVSLMPTLTGVGDQQEGVVYVEYFHKKGTPAYSDFAPEHQRNPRQQIQAIYLDGYKGLRYNILSADDDFGIFDTLVDPQETNDLAGTSPYFIELQQRMKDRVLQIRRPENPTANPGRPYDSALVPSVIEPLLTDGVEYRAYEGTWPWCPKLEYLEPVASGLTSTHSLAVRTRDEQIGLLYSGFIKVPTNGTYTFYLSADTAAYLRIHDASVIDADYGYTGGTEVSAKIHLEAGLHPYRLYYHHKNSAASQLAWKWSGPGIAKQIIPESVFKRSLPDDRIAPVATNDAATTPRNTPVLIPVLANDSDDGTPYPISIHYATAPAHGIAEIQTDAIRYQPDPGFLGTDGFNYTITDGSLTATGQVQVGVLFTNEVIWLPFNEGEGLQIHDAGGQALGELRGYTDASEAWVAGAQGSGLTFDGVNDQITLPGEKGISGTTARTISAWVKPNAPGVILAWGSQSSGNKWTWRIEENRGAQRVEVHGGHKIGSKNLIDGQWHHIAAVLENNGTPNVSEVRFYVDGVLDPYSSKLAKAINTAADIDLLIGTDHIGRHFTGELDEVKIIPRALTAAEIQAEAQDRRGAARAWHERYFGDDAEDWLADTDGDGLTQLEEYSFGTDPWSSLSTAAVSNWMENGRLHTQFPRRTDGSHDLNYRVETTDNLLEGWQTNVVQISTTNLSTLLELPTYQGTHGAHDGYTQQFMRVQIELP